MSTFKENFNQYSVTLKLTFLGCLALLSYVIITAIAVPTLSKYFDVPLLEFLSGNESPSSEIYRSLQWLQFFSTVALFTLPALIYIEWRDKSFGRIFGKFQKNNLLIWTAGLLLLPLWSPLGEYLTALLHFWAQEANIAWLNRIVLNETSQASLITEFISLPNTWDIIVNSFILVLLPAFSEELFFRASIQQTLMETRGPWKSILLTSLLFGVLHFQILNLPMLVFFGILLGILYYVTGNLWISISAHLLNNSITLYFAFQAKEYTNQVEEVIFEPFIVIPSTLIGIVALLFLLQKVKK